VQRKYGRKTLMSRLFLIISRCMAGCEGDKKKFQGFEGARGQGGKVKKRGK
jgi:hypothetical protein